jgi:hypothetical protein
VSGTKTNPVAPPIIARSSVFELPASTFDVIDEVLRECGRQDEKWGEQNHDPARWFAILGEEFGEVAKEVVGVTFAHPFSTNYRTELIQTAAVAIRMVESYDRQIREAKPRKGSGARPKQVALSEVSEPPAIFEPWIDQEGAQAIADGTGESIETVLRNPL